MEVKKRGRPKTAVKPLEVEPPPKEEPQEVPEAKSETKPKAAPGPAPGPSKRGRKPGKKSESGPGASEQAAAVIPPDLVSEEVRRPLVISSSIFS